MLHAVVSVHRTVVKESDVHVYCNCSSVQFTQILLKSGLDQKIYSANKKGVKFFETQCMFIFTEDNEYSITTLREYSRSV